MEVESLKKQSAYAYNQYPVSMNSGGENFCVLNLHFVDCYSQLSIILVAKHR